MLTNEETTALLLSLKVSLWCVGIMLPPSIFLGWLLAKKRFWGASLVEAFIHLPMVLPPVATGYILLLLFGRNGIMGHILWEWFSISLAFTWQGAVICSSIMGFPLMIRAIRLSISLIEPRLEQAASTLGAGPLRVFCTVTLPLAIPGIITGALLGFIRSLGEFGATMTFVGNIEGKTRTLPLALYGYIQTPGAEEPAMRLLGLSVALALTALMASEYLARRTGIR